MHRDISIILLLIVILSSFAYAQDYYGEEPYTTYEDPTLYEAIYGEPQYDEYYYFTEALATGTHDEVLAAVEDRPDLYMRFIESAPEFISDNPEAYETVVALSVEYINQDIYAFETYLETRGFDFDLTSTDEFNDYDPETGLIETRGSSGETVSSFTFENLEVLQERGVTNFWLSEGELSFHHSYAEYDVEGNLIDSGWKRINMHGSMDSLVDDFYLTDGGFSVDGIEISVDGENVAWLAADCGESRYCGFNIRAKDNPILLPHGSLLSGTATITSADFYELSEESTFVDNGAVISVTSLTRLSYEDTSDDCFEVYYSCIWFEEEYDYAEDKEKISMTIFTDKYNHINIEGVDGIYENIIVKTIYDDNTLVDLTLKRDDGSTYIGFSDDPTVSQGNLKNLETNVAHVFDMKGNSYAWLVYNGEPSQNTVGTTWNDLVTEIVDLGSEEEASLLIDAAYLGKYETEYLLQTYDDDIEFQEYIIDSYIPDASELDDYTGFAEKIEIASVAPELQIKMIEDAEQIDPKDVDDIFITIGDPELQRQVLEKADSIAYPGMALRFASPEVRQDVIEKTSTIEPMFVTECVADWDECSYPISEYFAELSYMEPEIQELAIEEFNFDKGFFAYEIYRPALSYNIFELHNNNPELMERLVDEMPIEETIGFDRDVFDDVFFDSNFQEQTRDMEFKERYALASTVHVYLEETGQGVSAKNVELTTILALGQEDSYTAAAAKIHDEITGALGVEELPGIDIEPAELIEDPVKTVIEIYEDEGGMEVRMRE